jgi:rubredoxin
MLFQTQDIPPATRYTDWATPAHMLFQTQDIPPATRYTGCATPPHMLFQTQYIPPATRYTDWATPAHMLFQTQDIPPATRYTDSNYTGTAPLCRFPEEGFTVCLPTVDDLIWSLHTCVCVSFRSMFVELSSLSQRHVHVLAGLLD